MARKRGGLAGIWDRNKQYIRPAASGIAGIFGGPLAGAALGAAMRGLDERSLRAAASGGLEGYGAGALGAGFGAKTGIGTKSRQAVADLFKAKTATGAAAGGGLPAELPGMDMTPRLTPGMTRSVAGGMDLTGGPSMAARPVGSLAAQAAPAARGRVASAASAVGTGVQKAAKFAQNNPKAVELALGQLPSAANEVAERGVAVQEARQALEQQQFDELMRRQRLQEEREALVAQLFSPLLQSRLSERNASMPPTSLGAYLRMNDFPDDTMPVTSSRAPAPMRSSVSPVRGGVAPVRSGVSPVSRLR
jgi:hypothetical protein